MSSSTNDFNDGRRISKVTISPISNEALVVRIQSMSTDEKEEKNPRMSEFKPVSRNPGVNTIHSKSTMTDSQKIASSSQTSRKEQKQSFPKTDNKSDPAAVPCLKHAALNISRKAADIPSEKINLCTNCSKSMLSYIFVVQDFLDSLAREISRDETPQCLQCARQEVRDSLVSSNETTSDKEIGSSRSVITSHSGQDRTDAKNKEISSDRTSLKRTSKARSHQESKRNEGQHKSASSPTYSHQQSQQVDFLYNVSPPSISGHVENLGVSSERCTVIDQKNSDHQNTFSPSSLDHVVSSDRNTDVDQRNSDHQTPEQQQIASHHQGRDDENQVRGSTHSSEAKSSSSSNQHLEHFHQGNEETGSKKIFRAPAERFQPNSDGMNPDHQTQHDHNNNFPVQDSPSLFREDVDGIVSTLSNAEREVYDTARNRAGWESLSEAQERLGYPASSNVISSEAFVTSCRNNAEAIGCLVVGTSLLLCRTTRTLCVLVADGVSTAFRGPLSAVFQVVQNVRSLDSLGTTKLALLEQPELGISLDKLNIWRLVQFNKCVYLNSDTLVIQNCDELFNHEELSAVPDIGWPDCFNSGVFVFSPSLHTFWHLMEFAEKQGSFDGGDQGLLNSYFNTWSSDISKKLSFIYNLMANVSYTYTPAFRQFGRNVKIVQFHGSFKPWHVKFFPSSGQISPSSAVHPTYVQFVHIWLNIFRISVLRLMSREIQSYAASQETICAVEILRFFPLPTESESEFFLTPPSVRLRLAEKKLTRSTSLPISEARRRKSAEFFRYVNLDEEPTAEASSSPQQDESKDTLAEKKDTETETFTKPAKGGSDEPAEEKPKDSISESDDVFKKEVPVKEKVVDENALPGAEVGDYHGMRSWEQGRMDYEGSDSSDNVIKRLQFLMSRPK